MEDHVGSGRDRGMPAGEESLDPSDAPARRSLVDEVYESLVEGLLDGSLDSGDSISIDGTARHLGVSPTPVREALARLESTGNVVRVPRRGYWVAELPNVRQMSDLMDARLLIEPHLAEMTCGRVTPTLLRDLEEAIEAMSRAPSGPEPAAIRHYHRADERFHRLIAEHAGNSALLRAYDALGGHGQRFRLFIGVGVQDAPSAISEHRDVLAALRRGNGPEVYRIMHGHIAGVKKRTLAEETEMEERHATRDVRPRARRASAQR
jgi:DNA-binding GntR family transcriptional regulator